jgi:putative ATPase
MAARKKKAKPRKAGKARKLAKSKQTTKGRRTRRPAVDAVPDAKPEVPRTPVAPLADRMRPRTLDEFAGQAELVGEGALLRRAIESDNLPNMILWGPPGSGKTSLAHVIARTSGAQFEFFSAVVSGVADVRRLIAEARDRQALAGRRTILFVDEIHRFNKLQQDAFLPHVEAGTICLIGATTENPSFELTGPLLSRCRVFKLEALSPADVRELVERALEDGERGLARLKPRIDEDALSFLVNFSNGDARTALNALEFAVTAGKLRADGGRAVTLEIAKESLQRKALLYDKSGEEHFNLISALHKSLRGSDAQAALYWLARMLDGGEDPIYIARRLVRFAAEDVGLADPQALTVTLAAKDAVHFIGRPEGDLALAEAAVYLAAAPKSNALYVAMSDVARDIREREAPPVPLHLRNAPTALMKGLGYGRDYQYDQDSPGRVSGQEFLPESLQERVYYRPGEYGFEREMAKRMAWWEKLRKRARGEGENENDER